jgi:membrane protease YdiL (CAAX protease family)
MASFLCGDAWHRYSGLMADECPSCGGRRRRGCLLGALASVVRIAIAAPLAAWSAWSDLWAPRPENAWLRDGPWRLKDVLLLLLGAPLFLSLTALFLPEPPERVGRFSAASTQALLHELVGHLAILAVVGFLLWRRHRLRPAALGFRRFDVNEALHAVLVALVASVVAAVVVVALLGSALGFDSTEPYRPELRAAAKEGGTSGGLVFLGLVVTAPLAEETACRGILFAGLIPRLRPGLAALVSSILFGSFHLQPNAIVRAAVRGLFLASLFFRTGSLWPPLALHAAVNAIAATS